MQSWILNKRRNRGSSHPERLIKEEGELQPEYNFSLNKRKNRESLHPEKLIEEERGITTWV